MKIGILTWSKELNHGAVLQTYATQRILKDMGELPIVLDYCANDNNMDDLPLKKIRRAIKRLYPNGIITRKMLPSWNKEKSNLFFVFRKENLCLGKMYDVDQGLQAVLIGSDMVFDFYEGYNPFMYGKNVNAPFIFTYAACFGYTTTSLLNKYKNREEIIYYLKKLDGISYRDDNTGAILLNTCGISDITKTIDPVLLYGFDKEKEEWSSNKWKNEKYILIYSYTYNMDKKSEILSIRKFAKKYNLKIIALGYIHLWCDEIVNADPKEFIDIFFHASYVITDTFHGTVFSIIFEKQFCTVIRNNAFKILDVLNEFNLEKRAQKNIENNLENVFLDAIDYGAVNEKMSFYRKKSREYISREIKKAEEKDDSY